VPPHSIEGESSVLGGLLLDNAAWDRVGDILMDGDFYRYEHRMDVRRYWHWSMPASRPM
jgi:replicative DNA helicase